MLFPITQGDRAATDFIAKAINQHLHQTGLDILLDYHLKFADNKNNEHLEALKLFMKRVIQR